MQKKCQLQDQTCGMLAPPPPLITRKGEKPRRGKIAAAEMCSQAPFVAPSNLFYISLYVS